jgi:hypothetical protein
MQNRLSLADLKAKKDKVLPNTEIFTGGQDDGCHLSPAELDRMIKSSGVGRN